MVVCISLQTSFTYMHIRTYVHMYVCMCSLWHNFNRYKSTCLLLRGSHIHVIPSSLYGATRTCCCHKHRLLTAATNHHPLSRSATMSGLPKVILIFPFLTFDLHQSFLKQKVPFIHRWQECMYGGCGMTHMKSTPAYTDTTVQGTNRKTTVEFLQSHTLIIQHSCHLNTLRHTYSTYTQHTCTY
jgi:hypothetical protein